MSVRPAEYGHRGLLGIATPQANPTVEAEMQALRPDGVGLVSVRLFCMEPDPPTRIAAYLDDMETALQRFDDLQLDAFGFFCTGSTYLQGHAAERSLVARLEDQYQLPIVTATAAIEAHLQTLDVGRIAMVSPYPDWLQERSLAYWRERGFEVTASTRVELAGENVHGIYALTTDEVLASMRSLNRGKAEAILFSGTGMVSLRAILQTEEDTGLPALSSNLCLAGKLFEELGLDGAGAIAPDAWAGRLDSL